MASRNSNLGLSDSGTWVSTVVQHCTGLKENMCVNVTDNVKCANYMSVSFSFYFIFIIFMTQQWNHDSIVLILQIPVSTSLKSFKILSNHKKWNTRLQKIIKESLLREIKYKMTLKELVHIDQKDREARRSICPPHRSIYKSYYFKQN